MAGHFYIAASIRPDEVGKAIEIAKDSEPSLQWSFRFRRQVNPNQLAQSMERLKMMLARPDLFAYDVGLIGQSSALITLVEEPHLHVNPTKLRGPLDYYLESSDAGLHKAYSTLERFLPELYAELSQTTITEVYFQADAEKLLRDGAFKNLARAGLQEATAQLQSTKQDRFKSQLGCAQGSMNF